jgi:membrane protease YdiL (CAAX protease family)
MRALAALVGSESFALPAESPLGQTLGDIGLLGLVLSLPVMFVSQLFTSPLLEELGWRGFALPMLQDKFNALGSSLILGLIWGAWHLPLILAYGDNILAYLALMIAHTVLMSWVFNSTGGSLLIALLFHASLNVSLNVLAIERQDVIQLLLTWAVVALVIVRYGAQDLSDSRRFRW